MRRKHIYIWNRETHELPSYELMYTIQYVFIQETVIYGYHAYPGICSGWIRLVECYCIWKDEFSNRDLIGIMTAG